MTVGRRMQMAASAAGGVVPVGVSWGGAIYSLTEGQADVVIDWTAEELGARWARVTIEWPRVQPTNSSTFDWTAADLLVTKHLAHGMQLVVMTGGSPAWARPTTSTLDASAPPEDPADFADWITDLVDHYGAGTIAVLEIWNEPNSPRFWGGEIGSPNDADPVAFAELLEVAYTAAKAADPAIIVVTGGLSPEPDGVGDDGLHIEQVNYLDQFLDELTAPFPFDGIGVHPYCYPYRPSMFATWSAWSKMRETSTSFLSVLAAHGVPSYKQKLWLTEWGAPTSGVSGSQSTVANNYGDDIAPAADPWWVDEEVQALSYDDAVREVRASPSVFGGLFAYMPYNTGASSSTDREQGFGLVTTDAFPTLGEKDAVAAMQDAVEDTGGW